MAVQILLKLVTRFYGLNNSLFIIGYVCNSQVFMIDGLN